MRPSQELRRVGKLPLIWEALRLSPCANIYALLNENHLVTISFGLGRKYQIDYLVSWTNECGKNVILNIKL